AGIAQTRMVAPASGTPRELNTMSSLRVPCAKHTEEARRQGSKDRRKQRKSRMAALRANRGAGILVRAPPQGSSAVRFAVFMSSLDRSMRFPLKFGRGSPPSSENVL